MAHAVKHFQCVNRRDRRLRTPLHWAAQGGHAGLVRVLLRCGADPTAEDRDGRTPVMLAADGGEPSCARARDDAVRALLDALLEVTDKSKVAVQHSVAAHASRGHVMTRIQREVDKEKARRKAEREALVGGYG